MIADKAKTKGRAVSVLAPLLPGSLQPDGRPATLGVVGGGQLGRMFVHAAQALGFETAVLDPDAASPAGRVSHHHIQAPYTDAKALARLAASCHTVTTEFENVPAQALETLANSLPVAPGAAAVRVAQDRALEKATIRAAGQACAPHAVISTDAEVQRVMDQGAPLFPAILKTARLGYDGKGQLAVAQATDLPAAWAQLGGVPCVLEKRLPLAYEISVVLARGRDGRVVHLPVHRNVHRAGILAVTEVHAQAVPRAVTLQAIAAAQAIAVHIGYVGVLCVEFFVLQATAADAKSLGRLVVNEMAPRPHNSGHHSIDACDVSQFELQARAMAGLPLPQPRLHSPAIMLNLLGDVWPSVAKPGSSGAPAWDKLLALPGVSLHLYGKLEARAGRKMGHLTVTAPTVREARAKARKACRLLGIAPLPGWV
jgi:5-(carboxyamino)imidazole ribonucleotide synthase